MPDRSRRADCRVWDQVPGVPVLREAPSVAERARLGTIDDLTGGAWGCQPAIGLAGECAWAEIRLREVPGQLLARAR